MPLGGNVGAIMGVIMTRREYKGCRNYQPYYAANHHHNRLRPHSATPGGDKPRAVRTHSATPLLRTGASSSSANYSGSDPLGRQGNLNLNLDRHLIHHGGDSHLSSTGERRHRPIRASLSARPAVSPPSSPLMNATCFSQWTETVAEFIPPQPEPAEPPQPVTSRWVHRLKAWIKKVLHVVHNLFERYAAWRRPKSEYFNRL